MSCKIEHKRKDFKGVESLLGTELIKIFKDIDKAKEVYDKISSSDFINQFGDWINEDLSKNVNDVYEPLLIEKIGINGEKNYYFLDKNNEKIHLLTEEFSSFNSNNLTNEIKEITEQLSSYIFKKHIKSNFNDLTNVKKINIKSEIINFINDKIIEYSDMKSLVETKGDINIINDMIIYINNIKIHIDEFEKEVNSFFLSKKLNISQDILEEDIQASQEEGLVGGDIKLGIEKNTKDNATSNVRLLLSFLPKYEYNSDLNIFEKQYGSALGEELFMPLDYIHKELLNNLSDIVTLNNSSDIYNQFINKITELSKTKYYYKDLLDLMSLMSEHKQSEFVSAFFNTRINFYTSIKSGSKTNSRFKVFNSTIQRNKSTELLKEWFNNFRKQFIQDNKKILNVEKLQKASNKFKESIITLNKFRKYINNDLLEDEFIKIIKPEINKMMDNFSFLGINNLSEEGFSLFLSNSKIDSKPVDIFNKIYDSNVKSIELLKILIDKPRNIKLNPFTHFKSFLFKSLSESQSFYNINQDEDTIISGGKMYWTYDKPSYISNRINTFKQTPDVLKTNLNITYNNNSEWNNHLLANDITKNGDYLYDSDTRKKISDKRLSSLELGVFNSFEEEGDSINSDNNVNISYTDQLVDEMNKVLKGGLKNNNGIKIGHHSIYSTSQAADKSTRYEIKIDYFNNDTISSIDGKQIIFDDKILDIYINYFLDEINRMKEAYSELSSLQEKDYKLYYHVDKNENIKDENNLLAGNAFKSQIFPEFSPSVAFIKSNLNRKINLYSEDGTPLFLDKKTFTKEVRNILKNEINKLLYKRLKTNFETLLKSGLIIKHFEDNRTYYNILGLDSIIKNNYKSFDEEFLNINELLYIISDYTINSTIANIEYTKLFTGDPAYYKNKVDFFKRVPATYTSGTNLRLLKQELDSTFTISVIENQINESKYLKDIEDSLNELNIQDSEKKYILKAYKKVNQTDAQGWITPERWKFLLIRLGKWNSTYDSVYNKIIGKNNEPFLENELKYASQPLKGVYFGIVNGVPTYLKYSQAVLVPNLIKGSQLELLYKNMINSNIDEAITMDGIKVGSSKPNKITDANNNIISTNLTKLYLNNSEWKLQQDLPTKLMKETLLGSQLQKNIFSPLDFKDDSKIYKTINGNIYNSNQILEEINSVISSLSNKNIDKLSNDIGKDENGKINVEKFYSFLEKDLIEKNYPINIIKAIQKELPLDIIPGIKNKMYNLLFSKIKKAAVKIKTNGGSYIQISNFGLDKIAADEIGVTWLVEPSELKPPLIVKDLDNKKTIKPGQIFISHSDIYKYIPNYRELSIEELNNKIDSRLLRAIGYRIPNQGLASNDPLQIVGILPPSMNDSVVAYTEITTKTGSDFDIDKMYIIIPSFSFKNGKLKYIDYLNNNDDLNIKQLQNKLFELYFSILTHKDSYKDLISPIDYDHIKNHIKKLHGDNLKQDGKLFKFYDPFFQLKLKNIYINGKSGIGFTANTLVDSVRSKHINLKFNNYYLGIGHKNNNNETLFDNDYSEKINGSSYKILDSISAFLNAFVDAAKDPYINDGNFNNYTLDTTFMLIRAGVHPFWINSFIGQPILKELVEFINIIESKSIITKQKWLSSFEKFVKIKETDSKIKFNNIERKIFTLDELSNKIINNNNNIIDDLQILKLFKEYQDKSKLLSESVTLSRFDTEGAGKDNIDALIYINRVKDILSLNDIDGELNGHIKKYVFNNKLTSLGTQLINTLEYSRILLENNPSLFLMASKTFSKVSNYISSNLIKPIEGGSKGLIKDKKLASLINKELYSYIMSDLDILKNIDEPLLFINNTIKNILDYKLLEQNLEKDEKNLFINSLSFNINSFGINSKNKSKEYKDSLYRSFNDLYKSNPSLVNNIIKSLYLQNGFNKNLIDYSEFIPHEWFINNNINGFFKQKFNEFESLKFSNDIFFKQLVQSNSNNKKLVPVFSNKLSDILIINNIKIIKSNGFIINNIHTDIYDKYILSIHNNTKIFVKYLQMNDVIYELQGYLNNKPVYLSIPTKGFIKEKSFLKIRDYKYNIDIIDYNFNKLKNELIKNINFKDISEINNTIYKDDIKNLTDILLNEINDVSLNQTINDPFVDNSPTKEDENNCK